MDDYYRRHDIRTLTEQLLREKKDPQDIVQFLGVNIEDVLFRQKELTENEREMDVKNIPLEYRPYYDYSGYEGIRLTMIDVIYDVSADMLMR